MAHEPKPEIHIVVNLDGVVEKVDKYIEGKYVETLRKESPEWIGPYDKFEIKNWECIDIIAAKHNPTCVVYIKCGGTIVKVEYPC